MKLFQQISVLYWVFWQHFFGVTFITNRYMSLGNGSWLWWSSLRYIWTGMFIAIVIIILRGLSVFLIVISDFRENYIYWSVAGGIGYGGFYASLCYGSQFFPAWLVAVTWQSTIIFSPIVLALFGIKVSRHIWPLLFWGQNKISAKSCV